jgi:hypothetical protein
MELHLPCPTHLYGVQKDNFKFTFTEKWNALNGGVPDAYYRWTDRRTNTHKLEDYKS